MTIKAFSRIPYADQRGRLVAITRRRIHGARRRECVLLALGDLTAVMPSTFELPLRSTADLERIDGQVFVELAMVRGWIERQVDQAARARLASFVAWAEAARADQLQEVSHA